MATLRDLSRASFTETAATCEEINTGSLQRIADACEKMAANITALMAERDKFAKLYQEEQEARKRSNDWRDKQRFLLEKRVSSLKGVITRMKNRSAASC